jgi:hypothetical protein
LRVYQGFRLISVESSKIALLCQFWPFLMQGTICVVIAIHFFQFFL